MSSFYDAFQSQRFLRVSLGWELAAPTIFFGAFFLFALQPLIAKEILPWFGGSAQVWATCLVFFQLALLSGYLYAHLLIEWVSRVWQITIHIALLGASLLFLPIVPEERWKPIGGEDPLILILGLLVTTIGLPFILLSATSPLVQAWVGRKQVNDRLFSKTNNIVGERSPYRLFALSNLGSMLALLSYPLLIEPMLPIASQVWVWSGGYLGFVILAAAMALYYRTGMETAQAQPGEVDTEAPSWPDRAAWFGLAAVPSALLVAVTNFILQNIAAIPLLYIVPLALYLLSFVFAFGHLRWYWPPIFYGPFIGAIVFMMLGLSDSNSLDYLLYFAAALFICCLVCHSELALLRPRIRSLTSYYLVISAGGATGGLFVAILAPALFNATYELAILLPAASLMIMICAWRRYHPTKRRWLRNGVFGFVGILLCIETFYVARITYLDLAGAEVLARNFYGALIVRDYPGETPSEQRRRLLNGAIIHGQQFTHPDKRREPTSYFSRHSGVGIVLDDLAADGPLHVGVIGLGVGTIAAYGRPNDRYRFYEINPLVLEIAANDFWYLDLNPADTEVVLGDARLSLERESPQQFDVLVVDAFLGDAIPIHLLTQEALALYWRHLKPDGVLAIQATNIYVDLAPIVGVAAAELGKSTRVIENAAHFEDAVNYTRWVIMTSRPGFFDGAEWRISQPIPIPRFLQAWTDDHSNLWRSLRF